MIRQGKIQRIIKSFLCGLCLILTGCSVASLAQESEFESAYENGGQEEPVDIYTSASSAVIEFVDEKQLLIGAYLLDRNESKNLVYSGATKVADKYGSPMTISQLCAGDLVEITYNSELEKAGTVTLSPDAWSYEGVAKYNLNAGNGSATIGDETYSIGSDVMVFSDAGEIDTTQIIKQDVISVQGKGHTIMSVTVDKGHGYLELVNEEAVLGGWIEIGQSVIARIEPDMLLTVPEGSYSVRITGDGVEEIRDVVIERNKETTLDLGDIKLPDADKGIVTFAVTPEKASVYVDQTKVDPAYPVKVPFGIHRITVEAPGYDSLSQYFDIKEGTNSIVMDLEETETVSGNSMGSYFDKQDAKIKIEAPEGAGIYQDNLYMGIAPVSYVKTAGEHTITLRREGYVTKSYTITVPDDDKDVTYAFPELDPEDGTSTVSGNGLEKKEQTVSENDLNTVSGNSVSGNAVNPKSE